MKKYNITAIAIILSASLLSSSCIGSFNLTSKVKDWNMGVSGDKFVNELIFVGLCIVPVYEISMLADLLVLNSIEFWTEKSPLASKSKKAKTVKNSKGENLVVSTNENGYTISNGKEEMSLVFDSFDNSWSVSQNGEVTKLLTIEDNNKATLFMLNGNSLEVPLDSEGMDMARRILSADLFAAK